MGAGSTTTRDRLRAGILEFEGDIGPGVVTGAADDDPSGIATYSQAGAQFGYGLLWTMILTYPLMAAVQLVSAHIGRVTGGGLARNLVRIFPHPVVSLLVTILLIANIFNIGADLSAMAAAAQLVGGGSSHILVIMFALACVLLQVFVPYRQYSNVLKWLTLSLFAYVGVVLLVHIDWRQAPSRVFVPTNLGKGALLTVVAVFGTTISPYLFFWQSSQEAEEVATTRQGPLKDVPIAVRAAISPNPLRHSVRYGILEPDRTGDHARHCRDAACAGRHQYRLSRRCSPGAGADRRSLRLPCCSPLGIIGTGLLAVPVLAGSAAFAVSETHGWNAGLEYKPREAARFYGIIAGATFIGVALDWSSLNPIKALFWSAVLNGVAAVPIMAAMMLVASSRSIMGHLHERRLLLTFGWGATIVMALASAALLVSSFSS